MKTKKTISRCAAKRISRQLQGSEAWTAEGYQFFTSRSFLKKKGGIFGCAYTFASPGDDGKEEWVSMIVVDHHFHRLSSNAQRFIIAHEVGHLSHGHDQLLREHPELKYSRQPGAWIPLIELEADEFAAQLVGKDQAIAALEEIQSYLAHRLHKKYHRIAGEMTHRIEAIQSL